MKIQYILHADFELPGIIETWAKQNQCIENFCRPFAKEKLPQAEDFDLLIIMGGPQSPLGMQEAPYLRDEISLIKRALHLKKPILGFCLGAQLIGEALGARTERSPYKEVGVFPIQLTEEANKDPLLESLPARFSVMHWHNDMPGLTSDAKVLAFSEGCPRQIVRYLPFVYGFQCHPEMTRQNIESIIQHCPDDLVSGLFVQSAEELLSNNFEAINAIMIQILNALLSAKMQSDCILPVR
jgi:GMP synthase (glutamine-hydrolysing)